MWQAGFVTLAQNFLSSPSVGTTNFLSSLSVGTTNFHRSHSRCVIHYLKTYVICQSYTTFYCIKYMSKLYLKDNDSYMFRLSFLSHLQVVTVGSETCMIYIYI